MIVTYLAVLALALLFCSAGIQIYFILKNKKEAFSHFLLLGASILLLSSTILRSVEINFIAITNTFETLLFFSMLIGAALFIYRIKIKNQSISTVVFGGTILQILFLALASSPLIPKEAHPPIPALQSAWLVIHVAFAFIGEAFFAVSFIASIYYLLTKNAEKKKNLETLIYHTIAIGYPIYTTGALIFGAIWAQKTWGTFWSWDPKETWALITWITYTIFLHGRYTKRLKGSFSAIFSIIGFTFTLFTYFGVNYLLGGLHAYN